LSNYLRPSGELDAAGGDQNSRAVRFAAEEASDSRATAWFDDSARRGGHGPELQDLSAQAGVLYLQRLKLQVLGQSPGQHAVGPNWRFRPHIVYRLTTSHGQSAE